VYPLDELPLRSRSSPNTEMTFIGEVMNHTRTLFLDYDGVLHPDAAYMVEGRPVLRADGTLFMWAEHLVSALADHPDVQIVLSTSWARELRFARARNYLPDPLKERVIGATWHSGMKMSEEFRPLGRFTWWDLSPRYQQIKRYVDRARLTKWLAIDDKPEGWLDVDRHHLVRTDGDKGLSDPVVQLQIKNWMDSHQRPCRS
jgi:hypothetical protein